MSGGSRPQRRIPVGARLRPPHFTWVSLPEQGDPGTSAHTSGLRVTLCMTTRLTTPCTTTSEGASALTAEPAVPPSLVGTRASCTADYYPPCA